MNYYNQCLVKFSLAYLNSVSRFHLFILEGDAQVQQA
jgi:hypothetical protein